ncbi:hypothetical protein [Aliagarivorans taiwanensis]|uniref:hypothetical protein n=1 Tax=Aliagarivorans taiwanensis TaxID=561966 RepID=UPI001FDFF3FD|nr:hypothetical protein [Aliagarivorans taiwanensis]
MIGRKAAAGCHSSLQYRWVDPILLSQRLLLRGWQLLELLQHLWSDVNRHTGK